MKRTLALFALTAVLLTACNKPAPVTKPAEPSLPTTWSPWDNQVQGYSFGLPLEWVMNEETSKNNEIIRFTSANGDQLEVSVYSAESLEAAIKAHDATTQHAYEGKPSVVVLDSFETTVGGKPAIERHEHMEAAGIDSYVAYVFHNQKQYQIRFTNADGSTPDREFFDRVLSTFAFAEEQKQ